MDQRREAYREQVALIMNDPNIPDHAKVMFQNAMGALYYQSGIETITLASNQTRTLSPFANMNSTINVDFHAFMLSRGTFCQRLLETQTSDVSI